MGKNKFVKHLLVLLNLISFNIIYISCASPPPKIPLFQPANNEFVTVRMYNGKQTAFIENTDFSFQISAEEDNFGDGMLTFFVGFRNKMPTNYLQVRYSDFKLSYRNNDGKIKLINKSCTFEEWVNNGYRSNYMRDRMRIAFHQYYLLENDVRPNGGNAVGLIAFPYDGFSSFNLSVNILGREYNISFN